MSQIECTIDEIRKIIEKSNLEEICDPHTGDCVSVAVAIRNVFGGKYVCGFEVPSDRKPVHAAVQIDGVLVDGSGTTSYRILYENVISGLKKDEYSEMEEHIFEVPELTNNPLYDNKTEQMIENRLRQTLQQFQTE